MRSSVSQLETYAACPFQHLTRYVLRLEERAESRVAPVDLGKIHHAILEDFVSSVATDKRALSRISDDDLRGGLSTSCDRISAKLVGGELISHGRDAYILRRSAEQLSGVMRAQARVAQAGKSRPLEVEVPFGFDDRPGLPAVQVTTPSGEEVLLRGFIDRVDVIELADEVLGVVIDYKATRNKRLDLSQVYHGLSLQLPAYMIALADSGKTLAGKPIVPIAALYLSLAQQYQTVKHPSDASERDSELGGSFRPRGLVREDTFGELDADCEGRSSHYAMFRKKDGGFGHPDSTDAADREKFEGVVRGARAKLGELAGRMLAGDVEVKPFRLKDRSPCSWCSMRSVCGFEMGRSPMRFLGSMKRTEVLARLAEAT